MITRPTIDQLNFNPDEANVDILDSGKQSLGFVYKEKLGSKVMNFLMKRLSVWTNWLIERIDAHETVGNVSLTLSDLTYDYIQEYFDSLKHNDYAITIAGSLNDDSKVLRIENIYGKGTITFNGATHTLGGIIINNVQQTLVSFSQDFGTNISQTSRYGLKILNSNNVYFENLNMTLGDSNDTNWVQLYVDNSKLNIYQPSFNGTYTGASAPTNMVYIINNSVVNISQDYAIQSSNSAGAVIGESMIYVDRTSFYDLGAVPTFSNWAQNYSFQIEMINYPKTEYPIDFNIDTGIAHVKTVLSNIESVNCHLQSIGLNDDVQDLLIQNIDGTGNIDIGGITCTSGCIVSNCNCTITLDDIVVQDQTSDGSYGLKIVDCVNVVLGTQTVIDAGTNDYEALLIDNSKVWVEDLRYINEPATPATNYVDITNNSNVYFKRILSGYASMIVPDSIFISIDSGSKVSVNNWVPVHVDTTSLKFKSINNGGFGIGYVSGTGYAVGYDESDITISTKP